MPRVEFRLQVEKQTVTQLRLNGVNLMSLDVRDATHADINTLIRLNEVVQRSACCAISRRFQKIS
jgi:hypothetical protein